MCVCIYTVVFFTFFFFSRHTSVHKLEKDDSAMDLNGFLDSIKLKTDAVHAAAAAEHQQKVSVTDDAVSEDVHSDASEEEDADSHVATLRKPASRAFRVRDDVDTPTIALHDLPALGVMHNNAAAAKTSVLMKRAIQLNTLKKTMEAKKRSRAAMTESIKQELAKEKKVESTSNSAGATVVAEAPAPLQSSLIDLDALVAVEQDNDDISSLLAKGDSTVEPPRPAHTATAVASASSVAPDAASSEKKEAPAEPPTRKRMNAFQLAQLLAKSK